MPIWSIGSILGRPSVTLVSWAVFEVPLNGDEQPWTTHLVGWACEDRQGQVSSRVMSFDPQTRRGKTASGRVYELRGTAGLNSDASYTWARWKSINDITQERAVELPASSTSGSL